MTNKTPKHVGVRVSKIQVVDGPKKAVGRSGREGWFYPCQCECGTMCLISQSEVITAIKGTGKRPRTLSCGCHRVENQLRGSLVDYRQSYKDAAKRRKLAFELPQEDFNSLVTQSCTYCGVPPETARTSYDNRLKRQRIRNAGLTTYRGTEGAANMAASIKTNGVDRIDNTRGYVKGNVTTCCTTCNIAKRDLSTEEFKTWLARIAKNFSLQSLDGRAERPPTAGV